jgi:6-phosphogluconolactonase
MKQAQSGPLQLYVGTYNDGASAGIHLCELDLKNGVLQYREGFMAGANPSFLAIHPAGKYLYTVNELSMFQDKPVGGVSAFAIEAVTGKLTLLNQRLSHGVHPCHIITDRQGRYVMVANYSSGTCAIYPIQAHGQLGEAGQIIEHQGAGQDVKRQAGPHAHAITMDPANRFALACDLGIDRVVVYRLDPEHGTLLHHGEAILHAGAGPRHLAFDPRGRWVYVINELDSTLTVFAYHAVAGTLKMVQTLTTLPRDYHGVNSCAEVATHPNGKFVYGSNRGHDSIVVYAADENTGHLTMQTHVSTQGKEPRSFAIDPTGGFLLAANQNSNTVVLFRIDPRHGALSLLHRLEISQPVCVMF